MPFGENLSNFCTFLKRSSWVKSVSCTSNARIEGKVVIVTGGNSGIGLEAARDLARRGGQVILACRNVSAGEQVAKEISEDTKNPNVEVRELDLSSMSSVRKFAASFKERHQKLDILINNAGIFSGSTYTTTVDGYEATMATNYLGHFLLTMLLLDELKAAAPSRVVNVSALGHHFSKFNWDDFFIEKTFTPKRAYCGSKLAQVMFTREFSRRLAGTGVTAYSLHPGVVWTNIGRNVSVSEQQQVSWLRRKTLNALCKTAAEGAQTTIYCAVSEDVANQSGLYYYECAVAPPNNEVLKQEECSTLWSVSEELVGLKDAKPDSGASAAAPST